MSIISCVTDRTPKCGVGVQIVCTNEFLIKLGVAVVVMVVATMMLVRKLDAAATDDDAAAVCPGKSFGILFLFSTFLFLFSSLACLLAVHLFTHFLLSFSHTHTHFSLCCSQTSARLYFACVNVCLGIVRVVALPCLAVAQLVWLVGCLVG